MNVAQATEKALQTWEETRDSDRHLIVAVWHLQNPNWQDNAKRFMLHTAFMPESITRCRRKLQEQGKYQPSNAVKKAREQKFRDMRYTARSATAQELPL